MKLSKYLDSTFTSRDIFAFLHGKYSELLALWESLGLTFLGPPHFYLLGILLVFFLLASSLLVYRWHQKRPTPEASPQERPTPEASPQERPTPEASPQERPAPEASPQERPTPEASPQERPAQEAGLLGALAQTRQNFFGRLQGVFSKKEVIQARELEEVEEILYTSDLGPTTVQLLLGTVEKQLRDQGASGLETLQGALKAQMLEIFDSLETPPPSPEGTGEGPQVWMVVGVNGAGKTTSIGKLGGQLAREGRRVLLAAGDTFRAAAGEQLKVWTERAQVEIFHPPQIRDPSAVAFEALQRGRARGFDLVIIDTAGRLHTQKNLMEELKKMKRVLKKVIDSAPHETLLVLDGSSGQNALVQARQFHEALGVSGVILTKMDGTARGGVALGVAHELKIPIHWIGVGEALGDLRKFQAKEYVEAII